MKYLIYFIVVAIVLFFVNKFLKQFKIPKTNSIVLVNGGVKCGKSTFSVALVRREYKARVRAVKIRNFFRKLFHKPLQELPLIYSNVPLACPYVPLTTDYLLRKKRFVYGSVVYMQEASLIADSQLIKDKHINNELLMFFKLFGHESKGGVCILDTQCISDLHYSIKRCLSEYFYIHHLVKFLPWFLIAYVQENRYSDDGSIVVENNDDVELKLRKVILSKRNWKYFDCYCYSVLTDNLLVQDKVVANNLKTEDLKARTIPSFNKNLVLEGDFENEKKDD